MPVPDAVPLGDAAAPVGRPELAGSNEMPAVFAATGMPAMPPACCAATEESRALLTPAVPPLPLMRLRSTCASPGVVIWRSR